MERGLWWSPAIMGLLARQEISMTEGAILALVDCLSRENGACTASNAYICETLGLTEPTLWRHLTNLTRRGLLERGDDKGGRTVRRLTVRQDLQSCPADEAEAERPKLEIVPDPEPAPTPRPKVKKAAKKPTPVKEELPPTPDWWSAELKAAWNEWMAAKTPKRGKAPYTAQGLKRQYTAIEKACMACGEKTTVAAIYRAIDRGWKGWEWDVKAAIEAAEAAAPAARPAPVYEMGPDGLMHAVRAAQ